MTASTVFFRQARGVQIFGRIASSRHRFFSSCEKRASRTGRGGFARASPRSVWQKVGIQIDRPSESAVTINAADQICHATATDLCIACNRFEPARKATGGAFCLIFDLELLDLFGLRPG